MDGPTEERAMMNAKGMDATVCLQCGGEMKLKPHTHVERVGEYTITINAGAAMTCANCCAVELPMGQLRAFEVRSALTVLLERPISGGVLKYARKAIGLRQVDLACLIGHESSTISKWETGAAEIPEHVRMSMIGLLKMAEAGATPEGLISARNALRAAPMSPELTAEPPPELGGMRRTG